MPEARYPHSAVVPPPAGLPALDAAKVSDVMTPGVISCSPDTPMEGLARTMATYRIHALVVSGVRSQGGRAKLVWKVVSDRDLLRPMHEGAQGLTAADLASAEVTTIDSGTLLSDAAQLMDEQGTSHLIVVEQGWPVGVISTFDLATAVGWAQ